MRLQYASLKLVLLLLVSGLAAPDPARLHERAYLATCGADNLYRSFTDPRYSSSASAFCSTYIRSTISAVKTTTKITTVTASAQAKRDLPATTAYPPARLSSACSCILTVTPQPTTVYTSTKTVTRTTTTSLAPPSCTDAKTIVQNGNFETCTLDPWIILDAYPALPGNENVFSYNVTSPGYNSKCSFIMRDDQATSVTVTIGQTVSVCPGRKYRLSAQIFMTDGHSVTGRQDEYSELYVDDLLVASADRSYIQGPPILWKPLSGEFYANANADTVTVKVYFLVGASYLTAQWGVDNVVLTPLLG